MGRVIAIDGPSGAGKSTVSKMLAEKLGFEYLDTGALYRATALALRKKGVVPEDSDEKIAASLRDISIEFANGKVFADGRDVSDEIRTKEAGHYSSVFSARRPVRAFLLPLQRAQARTKDIVAEGRDMTTVVFPDAWKKFYLDASAQERAQRRYGQLLANGRNPTVKDALEDVLERDKRDSSRDLAPLRRADDAVYIDTTEIAADEVVKKMLQAVKS